MRTLHSSIKNLFFAPVLFAIGTASATANSQDENLTDNWLISEAEISFLERQPSAKSISPGVYSIPSNKSVRTYAFGLNGMAYAISRLEQMIIDDNKLTEEKLTETVEALNNLKYEYSKEIELLRIADSTPGPKTTNNSGTICQALRYDLTASTNYSYTFPFSETEAVATAGFLQWGGGPPIPWPTAELYTYSEVDVITGGIFTDDHTEQFQTQGLAYLSVTPANVQVIAPAECTTANAFSYISVAGCPGGFQSVSEDFSAC